MMVMLRVLGWDFGGGCFSSVVRAADGVTGRFGGGVGGTDSVTVLSYRLFPPEREHEPLSFGGP